MLQTGMSEAYAVTPRPGEPSGSRVRTALDQVWRFD
jgi:hypothetical protein